MIDLIYILSYHFSKIAILNNFYLQIQKRASGKVQ